MWKNILPWKGDGTFFCAASEGRSRTKRSNLNGSKYWLDVRNNILMERTL